MMMFDPAREFKDAYKQHEDALQSIKNFDVESPMAHLRLKVIDLQLKHVENQYASISAWKLLTPDERKDTYVGEVKRP